MGQIYNQSKIILKARNKFFFLYIFLGLQLLYNYGCRLYVDTMTWGENSRQFSLLTRIVCWSVRSFSRRGGDGVKVVKGGRGNRYFIALQVLL